MRRRRRLTPAHPWKPLTDAEYAALRALLPGGGGGGRAGRPPGDRRRTLDAIFWVACSRGPWRALPPELGRADSVHRQFRRWARAGVLDRLLVAVSEQDWSVPPAVLRGLEYRICRAWRRAARLVGVGSLVLARRLGLLTALPCAPWFLPDPDLSEIVQTIVLRRLESPWTIPRGFLTLCDRLLAAAGGARHRFRLA